MTVKLDLDDERFVDIPEEYQQALLDAYAQGRADQIADSLGKSNILSESEQKNAFDAALVANHLKEHGVTYCPPQGTRVAQAAPPELDLNAMDSILENLFGEK